MDIFELLNLQFPKSFFVLFSKWWLTLAIDFANKCLYQELCDSWKLELKTKWSLKMHDIYLRSPKDKQKYYFTTFQYFDSQSVLALWAFARHELLIALGRPGFKTSHPATIWPYNGYDYTFFVKLIWKRKNKIILNKCIGQHYVFFTWYFFHICYHYVFFSLNGDISDCTSYITFVVLVNGIKNKM